MTQQVLKGFGKLVWKATNGQIIWLVVLSLITGLTEGVSLFLLIPVTLSAGTESVEELSQLPAIGNWLATAKPPLSVLLSLCGIMVIGQALLTRFKSIFSVQVMQATVIFLKNSLLSSISGANWEAINQRRRADLQSVLSIDADRVMLSISSSVALFNSVVMLLVYMALATLVSWQMTLFAVVVGGLLFGAMFPVRRRAQLHGEELIALHQDQNQTVLEFLNGIRLSKLFNAETRHVKNYEEHLKAIKKSRLIYIRSTTLGTMVFQICAALVAALFVWLSIEVANLGIAQVIVLLVVFLRLAPRFNSIQSTLQQLLTDFPAYKNYSDYLKYFEENREPDEGPGQKAPVLASGIAFSHVSHAYPEAENMSLDGVSLELPAGEITALIGPSGSGKSTIADLVMGLTRPEIGDILVDDTPIVETNRRAWRSSVACVPQDAFLMNDTVEQNLRIGSSEASEEEMWAALDQANIGDLLRSLPDGLQTMAGDRGTRFSGGERQRIALARALLRKPQFLVLDEATSALDWESQKIIANAIRNLKGKLTILTIAHRPSLINFADNVISLQGGVVTESGSFAELRQDPDSALSKMLAGDQAE